MLVLSRKCGESVLINQDITVKVIEISGDKVKLGIDAPDVVRILRKELFDTIRENREAARGVDTGAMLSFLHRLEGEKSE